MRNTITIYFTLEDGKKVNRGQREQTVLGISTECGLNGHECTGCRWSTKREKIHIHCTQTVKNACYLS